MNLFTFLQFNPRSIATRARHSLRSRSRALGAQFELLESRCLLSVAPPTAGPIISVNPQYSDYYVPALVSRDVAATGGNTLAPTTGLKMPSLPSANSYPLAPMLGLQFQPLGAQEGIGSPAITNGMIDIGGLTANGTQAFPMVPSASGAADHESRAVQDMLSTLKYVPMSGSAESQIQPPAPSSADASSPPSFSSTSPSVSTSALPAMSSPLSSSDGAPSTADDQPSAPGSLLSSPATASPATTPAAAPSSTSGAAPNATSLEGAGREAPQRFAEGGMVSIVRQPVAQASTVDRISMAAIDALLEVPAKVEGAHGRFQAFEISVTREMPLPVAPVPAGIQTKVPLDPANHQTPPVMDSNVHGAWIPSGPAGANLQISLPSDDFSSSAFLPASNLLANDQLPLGVLPHEAIDAAFGELSSEAAGHAISSSAQLDLATATLLAALIGRALWQARIRKAGEQEKRADSRESSSIPPLRLGLDPIVPG